MMFAGRRPQTAGRKMPPTLFGERALDRYISPHPSLSLCECSPDGRRGFLLSSKEERIEVRRNLNLFHYYAKVSFGEGGACY